jgi:hypothetical protein
VKKLILPLGIAAMLLLIGAAVVWDCLLLDADARHRVALADGELKKHEERLVKLLLGSPKSSPEVTTAITVWEQAKDIPTRHAAYEDIVAAFRKTMFDDFDPNNTLDRKFADDVAGAINRREVAQKPYDEERALYQNFLNSINGAIVRQFNTQSQKDWMEGV